jgi:TolA-binding protein
VRLYEVMNADDPDLRQSKRSTRGLHEAGLTHFRNGDLAQAAQSWRDCLALSPEDPVTHYWLQRCEQQNPPKQTLGVV